jgi:DNA repair exonuclease SbcCD nuclease subunit
MITKVQSKLNEIDKIFHISDVHIRNLKRHEEYNQVFDRLYAYIEKNKTPNSVIFLGGDIVHAKTDMTPELVQMVQKFLKACADICTTILITGNHDCNLNNKNRLDALDPIVNAINHTELIYLKESGVYHIANIHFTVMSVFDRPVNFIKANEFEADYKIALHHGAVDTSVTDTGHKLSNIHVPVNMFDGYDLTLLGDIHVPAQYLNKENTIAYPGSTIQQNYSESLNHGILVWDVKTKKSEFVVIPNDYGFYTLDIVDGKYILPNDLPKNLRLRLRVQNTNTADIKTILADIKTLYNVLETPIQKINTNRGHSISNINKVNIGDVRDIEFQNQLLSDYLKQTKNTDDIIIDGVKHVNRKCNSLLHKLETNKNTVWIPKRFTFSNMFSYGEDNVIDFSQLKGLYGIFAPNAAGKSTLFESLAFCIFDKCNRTSRAEQILNSKCKNFSSRFEFTIDNDTYVIERNGKTIREHIRVEVNFYQLLESGEQKSLNGKERSDTNKVIRTYLGTYEDFVLTALSVQNNNTGFIDMGQRERKELLAQFLDSDIFEHLYKIANEESKDISTIIKDLSKKDLDGQLAIINVDLEKAEDQLADLNVNKIEKDNEIHQVFEEINTLSESLIPLTITNTDINRLLIDQSNIKVKIVDTHTNINNINKEIQELQNQIDSNKAKLQLVNLDEINSYIASKDSIQKQLTQIQRDEKKVEVDIQHKEAKMSKLDKLEYDQNCNYCMNNIFVKDAIDTKQSLSSDYQLRDTLLKSIAELNDKLQTINEFEKKKKAYDFIVDSIKRTESTKLQTENKKLKFDNDLIQYQTKLQSILNDIQLYEQHKESISKNNEINTAVAQKRVSLSKLKSDIQNIDKALNECLFTKSNNISKREFILNELSRLSELQKEYSYYQLYMDSFSRDGVPYQLIAKALPKIELEVNNILTQVVDYQVHLNTDGKNINAFIVYDSEKFWPLELASGMEKFVASLAIRTALINISSLPRPVFLVIDEGLGNLDAENLNNMYVLFDYLKTQFEYIIVISHIESIRDMVDSVIEITKVNEQSSITYE